MPAYQPLDQFTILNDEQSSEPIRNYPADKAEFMLNVFPDTLEFTNTKVGDNSSPVPVVLINTGYSPLIITNVEVVGPFELVSSFPQELQPDQAVSILVRFTPKWKGPITGGLYLETGNAAGREFIKLTGVGTSAFIANMSEDIIRATNTGLGTANAIQATTEDTVPLATGAKLIALDIKVNNTGATTVQFNDMAPLTVLEVDGTGLESGDLVADTMVLGYISGSNFRLLTDATNAAALYLLNEHRTAAEDAADAAEADRLVVQDIYNNFMSFNKVVDLDNVPAHGSIEIEVSASGAILGDVFLGASMSINTGGLVFKGYVSADDTLKIVVENTTGTAINLASATLKAKLLR